MSWSLYRWVWRLESPLHIGMMPAGALNRCRLYVPAWALWGALTAEIARGQATGNSPQYREVGGKLKQDVRFTYLYPAEEVGNGSCAWLPRYEEGKGLVWQREDGQGILTNRQMRVRLLSTQPGTAIEPSSDTAADGTLREVEYMLPRWRDNGSPLFLIGYLFLKDQTFDHDPRAIQEITLGGETRYGFGRLQRIYLDLARDCFGIATDLSRSQPILQGPECVLAHTRPEPDGIEKGAMEIVLGWDVGILRPVADATPHWVPGSRVNGQRNFAIRGDGLWEIDKIT